MSEELIGKISYDLWNAYRKFANEDIVLIAKTLYSKPSTLGELREETGIKNSNLLNQELIEMRNVCIVKKIDKKYHLTKYGAILLESLDQIKNRLSDNEIKDVVFNPKNYS